MLLFLFAALVPLLLVLAWPRCQGASRWSLVVLALICGFAVAHQIAYRTLAEDAFITFRYAHHWAVGDGPVFNPGERVEGYSNFLLLAMLTIKEALFGGELILTARVIGVVSAVLTILLTYLLCLRLPQGNAAVGLVAALLVAASGPYAAYALSGMETLMMALGVIATLYALVRHAWVAAGVFIGLSTLTHLEGVLLLLPACAWAWQQHDTRRGQLLAIMKLALGSAAIGIPWTVWRLAYYGHLLPNSVAAKSGIPLANRLRDGIRYVLKFTYLHLPILIVLCVTVAALLAQGWRKVWKQFDAFDGLLGGIVAMYAGYVVWVGGDWMPGCRFLVPIVAPAAVLLARLAQRAFADQPLSVSWRPGAAMFAMVALISLMFSKCDINLIPVVEHWHNTVDGLGEVGQWLHKSLPPETEIAVFANGALSYYSELPTIDIMGLTDEHIALHGLRNPDAGAGHAAHDHAYIVGRKPVLVTFTVTGFEPQPTGWTQIDVMTRKELPVPWQYRADYQPVAFRLKNADSPFGKYVNLLLLRSERDRTIRLLTASGEAEAVLMEEDSAPDAAATKTAGQQAPSAKDSLSKK